MMGRKRKVWYEDADTLIVIGAVGMLVVTIIFGIGKYFGWW